MLARRRQWGVASNSLSTLDPTGVYPRHCCPQELVLYRERSGGESFGCDGFMSAGAFSIQH